MANYKKSFDDKYSINNEIMIHNLLKTIKLTLIAISFLFSIGVTAQEPYAAVKIDNNIYFDETEIDVGSWLSYYSWTIVHKGYNEAQKVLPDSSAVEPELWTYIKTKSTDYIDKQATYSLQPIGNFEKACKICEKFGKRLASERKYCSMLHFPITGLTFEQVTEFCKWRTVIEGNSKTIFRLPTPDEWRNFAFKGLTEIEKNSGLRDSINAKNCAFYNYKIKCDCNKDLTLGIVGIGMYSPEKTGAFDVFGNVSEMTSIKGLAKGGSFRIYAKQCNIDSIQYYNKPEIWLGFRCIIVISVANPQAEIPKEIDTLSQKDNKFGQFLDTRDNKSYPTVQINNQTWLAANLAFKPDSGRFWYPEDNIANESQYGLLYNWETAKNVCPIDWHLPSKEDFEVLLSNVGGKGTIAAYKELFPSGNSGFSLLLTGSHIGINFVPNGLGGILWSSTEDSKRVAWIMGIGTATQKADLNAAFNKKSGLSVRCIKNK